MIEELRQLVIKWRRQATDEYDLSGDLVVGVIEDCSKDLESVLDGLRVEDLEEANRRLLEENEELKADKDLLQIVRWGLLEAEKNLDDSLGDARVHGGIYNAMFIASKRITDALDALSNMKLTKELRDEE